MTRPPTLLPLLLLLGCADKEPASPTPEPLDLPADPAEAGVPVGVQTYADGEITLEIWYPAPDSAAAEEGESFDLDGNIPDSVTALIGAVDLPSISTTAVRDAALRVPETPYPVLIFSHGFGGTRQQSTDITTHLASRGYVVVAPDHPGRMMDDVIPCLFSPPAEGCDLSGFASDPGVEGVETAADLVEDWAGEGFFAEAIDPLALGLFGHSAGAGTTLTAGAEDERFQALLPMAGAAVPERDVPVLLMGGTCDSFATDADLIAVANEGGLDLIRIAGAGHLAFANLCELDLPQFAETYLSGRDDLNETVLDLLIQLASDGCPGAVPAAELACGDAFLPLETSTPIIDHYSTVFFDDALRGTGPGVTTGVFAEALGVP